MELVLVIAALLSLVALSRFGQSSRCVMCGGKNAHRDGCPRA